MTRVRRATPLNGWLVALVLVLPMPLPLFFPLVSSGLTSIEGPYESHYRNELTEYLKVIPGGRDQPRGVMLAMSGGSCATTGPQRLAANGADIYVAFYNDATLASFAGLVDLLIDANLDFVAIQDTIFVQTPVPQDVRLLYQDARSFWFDRLVDLSRILRGQEIDLDDENRWRCRFTFERQGTWPSSVQRAMDDIGPYSERKRSDTVGFLKKFSEAGVPVLIVSPPANEYTATYRRAVFQAASRIIDTSPPLANVSMHRQAELTPAAQFLDPFHLTHEENQSYRDWLNDEVFDVLRVQENR